MQALQCDWKVTVFDSEEGKKEKELQPETLAMVIVHRNAFFIVVFLAGVASPSALGFFVNIVMLGKLYSVALMFSVYFT